jgi:Leucine-rich repeat (LRR) protein
METYDDLSNGPNPDGSLNLSYNQWEQIPTVLYELHRHQLTKLSLSHNKFSSISNQIQQLLLLQELDLSNNEIRTIDGSIGQCIRLRKLNLEHNKLTELPKEIGQNCFMLQSLLLNDNDLVSLPDLVLPALETLDLRNNNLQTLSSKLSCIITLRNIPCDGNTDLTSSIPLDMQLDSELVLFALRLQETYKSKVESRIKKYQEIEAIAKGTELEKLRLNFELETLQDFADTLRRDRPLKYIELKDISLRFVSQSRERIIIGIQWIKGKIGRSK